jgi:hypothetical protein
MSTDERIERARLLYERSIFDGDAGALVLADRELDAVEADLALARGRIIHGRFLEQRDEEPEQPAGDPHELVFFERAAQLYQALGDLRGEAESLFWSVASTRSPAATTTLRFPFLNGPARSLPRPATS